jgi:hypothetical protein
VRTANGYCTTKIAAASAHTSDGQNHTPEQEGKKMEYNFYKGSAINKGGVMPYVDSRTNIAYFSTECLNNADNKEVLTVEGITNIVVSVYPNYLHIEQIGGYTYESGLFCKIVG